MIKNTTKDTILDVRTSPTDAPANFLFNQFSSLGGEKGWLFFNWAWKLRGWFDGLIGGVGMRPELPLMEELQEEDALDFWVVEQVLPGERLRLRAEMKLPGEGWLEFAAVPAGPNSSILTQTATFIPRGNWGLLYWYLLYPIHSLIFSGLARRISLGAESDYTKSQLG